MSTTGQDGMNVARGIKFCEKVAGESLFEEGTQMKMKRKESGREHLWTQARGCQMRNEKRLRLWCR